MAVEVEELIVLVDQALRETSGVDQLSAPVTAQSKMGEPEEWDSLSFISVFTAVAEQYEADLADDDAYHFTSIPAMHAFLNEIL